ncbi:MAG TPA: cupin domain-containing protein [Candidatus Binatia bacterium]|jgi:quercetin dioxygenase-like cupin family protein
MAERKVGARRRETGYDRWMKQEGLPIVEGHGVTDVRSLDLGPWKRLGGSGAFVQLFGMDGLTGMYVAEIPPGGALNPEKHMYEEVIYVVSGSGAVEIGDEKQKPVTLEWQEGSLFAPPLNVRHKLFNGSGSEPARFVAMTNAPLVVDLFYNPDFILNCPFPFTDRFDGRADYYKVGERILRNDGYGMLWETNAIPDLRTTHVDVQGDAKGKGVLTTGFELSGNVLAGHMAEWPVGIYHKAHYHGGGAVFIMLRSRGYTLLWPREAGMHPYKSGQAHKVVRIDWREGSVLSPASSWFHQHFNTGAEPARLVAIRYGSYRHDVAFHAAQSREGTLVDIKLGGTMIEYEDEDPEIRRQFKEELKKNRVEYRMEEASPQSKALVGS